MVYSHHVEAVIHAVAHASAGLAAMSKFLVDRMTVDPDVGEMTEQVEQELEKSQGWLRAARKPV